MGKQTDGQLIVESLELLTDKERVRIERQAQRLMLTVRMRYPFAMFGKMMAYETLYKLGRFMNEEFPEE